MHVLPADHLVPILVMYIGVCVIDKIWCEYKPNQTIDYPVNPRLITSKNPTLKAVLTQWLTTAS